MSWVGEFEEYMCDGCKVGLHIPAGRDITDFPEEGVAKWVTIADGNECNTDFCPACVAKALTKKGE